MASDVAEVGSVRREGQGRGCHREQCRLVETTSHEQANWARLGGLEQHWTKSSRSRHQTLKHYWAPALRSSAPSCCTVLLPWRERDELEALRALARAGRTVEYALRAMPRWIGHNALLCDYTNGSGRWPARSR